MLRFGEAQLNGSELVSLNLTILFVPVAVEKVVRFEPGLPVQL